MLRGGPGADHHETGLRSGNFGQAPSAHGLTQPERGGGGEVHRSYFGANGKE